jgi:hypothetical protein
LLAEGKLERNLNGDSKMKKFIFALLAVAALAFTATAKEACTCTDCGGKCCPCDCGAGCC